MVKSRKQMPSQFPALRLTVARQMAGYEERIAQRIRREAQKRGESPVDLASALGTHPSTTERWFRGERTPQKRHRKDLAEHYEVPYETFEPDLEAEEKEVRDQLNRIENSLEDLATGQAELSEKLDELLAAQGRGQQHKEDGG